MLSILIGQVLQAIRGTIPRESAPHGNKQVIMDYYNEKHSLNDSSTMIAFRRNFFFFYRNTSCMAHVHTFPCSPAHQSASLSHISAAVDRWIMTRHIQISSVYRHLYGARHACTYVNASAVWTTETAPHDQSRQFASSTSGRHAILFAIFPTHEYLPNDFSPNRTLTSICAPRSCTIPIPSQNHDHFSFTREYGRMFSLRLHRNRTAWNPCMLAESCFVE